MGIPQDIHARLVTALGPDIPVLLPEQQREPLEAAPIDAQGRPMVGAGERGLGAYLRQHPQGYVQIEPPVPLLTGQDGIQQQFWFPLSSNASTEAACEGLHAAVHLALCGIPGRDPGHYTETQPGLPMFLTTGVWQARFVVTRLIIAGQF